MTSFGRRPYSQFAQVGVSMAFGQKRPDDDTFLGRCPRLRWAQAFGQRRTNAQPRSITGRKRGKSQHEPNNKETTHAV